MGSRCSDGAHRVPCVYGRLVRHAALHERDVLLRRPRPDFVARVRVVARGRRRCGRSRGTNRGATSSAGRSVSTASRAFGSAVPRRSDPEKLCTRPTWNTRSAIVQSGHEGTGAASRRCAAPQQPLVVTAERVCVGVGVPARRHASSSSAHVHVRSITSEASTTAPCVADSCSRLATELTPLVAQRPSVVHRGSWYDHHRTPAHSASSQILARPRLRGRPITGDDVAGAQASAHERASLVEVEHCRARSGRRERSAAGARRGDVRARTRPIARTTRTPRRPRRPAHRYAYSTE